MVMHSKRRCHAPPHRGRYCLGTVTCGVGAAIPLFIFSPPLQRMSSASEVWRSSQYLLLPTDGAKCRGSEANHSRVAERTHLFPEGEYSGKC